MNPGMYAIVTIALYVGWSFHVCESGGGYYAPKLSYRPAYRVGCNSRSAISRQPRQPQGTYG